MIIGAGQLSRAVAQMALMLDFEVVCCDPREEYHLTWDIPGTTFSKAMPDDLVVELQLDPHSAVIAVTHDPKLDDMALLEALKSPAFYVGALGSRGNTAKRKERLALFDLSPAEIDRLHGPVGLDLGSKTPAEIAVSIVAEIVSVKNGVTLLQKKDGSAVPEGVRRLRRAALIRSGTHRFRVSPVWPVAGWRRHHAGHAALASLPDPARLRGRAGLCCRRHRRRPLQVLPVAGHPARVPARRAGSSSTSACR